MIGGTLPVSPLGGGLSVCFLEKLAEILRVLESAHAGDFVDREGRNGQHLFDAFKSHLINVFLDGDIVTILKVPKKSGAADVQSICQLIDVRDGFRAGVDDVPGCFRQKGNVWRRTAVAMLF
jgi:hypothetical protein